MLAPRTACFALLVLFLPHVFTECLPGRTTWYKEKQTNQIVRCYGDDMMPEHMRHVQESQRDFPGNADEYTFLPGRKGLRELRDGPSQKKQAAAFRAATEKYRAAENRQGSGNTNPVYSDEASLIKNAEEMGRELNRNRQGEKSTQRDQANPGWLSLDPGQRRAHEAPARLFNPRIANPTDPKNPINTPDKAIPSMDVKVRNPPPPARFGKGPGKSDPLWDGKPGEKGRPIDPATNKPYTTEQPQSRVYLEPKKTDVFKSGGEAGPDKKTAGIGPPTEKQSLTRQPPRPQNGDHWERMKKAGEWKPPAPPAPPPQPESKDGSNKGQSTSKNVANPKFVPRPLDPKQKQSQEAPARLPNPDNKPDNPPPPPPSNPGNLADTKKTQPAADNAKKPDTNKAKPVNKTIPQSSRVLGSATKKDQPKPTPKTKPRKAAGGRRKLGRRGK
ncbi:hypothetical protein MCOR27_009052 [Pyricularia oryzae]|uniref:Uncharacterized protein n=1 Tax=Pyricularia oryzae TaxID=318829 RepID=A0A4P7MT67_PYROR|nr:hypothetical protein MCOR02_005128 [Pyricularia oryzae]KAI6270957.1 hypothetical protein MCOR27_009052 [Pyricularia oryzae]KAI6321438.1 hypothetical protein MCOR34_002640 [Pyricularia oryzae]KAI6474605.1 hypothetical protein MCOR17_002043 [Pyricularia oryzae]KAI6585982.1 hypothetical protein MCOR06_006987 [Pyricularia oryzae]